MKKIKTIFLLIFLNLILVYVTNITSIPNNILLFQGEKLNLKTVFGVYLNQNVDSYNAVQTSGTISSADAVQKGTVTVSLFNILDIKKIDVNIIPEAAVIPLGNTVGLKLYASGVLVVGKTEIEGKKPYENTGIEEGDMIISINEKNITSTSELIECVNNCNGENINIKYVRNGAEYLANIEPAKTKENEYKLGLWVRDGAAGIGTITYYEPKIQGFAALGHGIVDIDTEKLIKISSGELVTTSVISIVKGEEAKPGQIKGSIANSETIGTVSINTEFGIYGNLNNTTLLNINNLNELKVATRDEIKTGPAKIILTLEDEIRKEYDIEITKIYKNNDSNNKSMMIKVTDQELLDLTRRNSSAE